MKVRGILKQSGASFLVANIVYVLTFLGNIALVRMLLPEDFGVVALAASLVGLIEIFTTFAFNTVLIQQRDQASLVRTVFQGALAALVLKLVLAVLVFVAAHGLYDSLIWIIFAVITASKMFSGLGPLLVARLEKRGDFLWATFVTSGSALIGVLAAVAAVSSGAGLYGLLLREALPPMLVFAAMVVFYRGLLPRGLLNVNRRQLRVVASAATRLYFQRGAELAYMRLPLLMIEALFGAVALGLYAQATYLVTLINRITGVINQQVATVFFSRNRRNARETRLGFLWLLGVNLILALPAMALLTLYPEQIVLFLWDEDWLAAVPYLQLMAAMTFLLPLFSILKSRLLGLRRNHAITAVYGAGLVFLVGGLWIIRDVNNPALWVAGLTAAVYALLVVVCACILWQVAKGTHPIARNAERTG
jgi:PST family polysaccharide transporter